MLRRAASTLQMLRVLTTLDFCHACEQHNSPVQHRLAANHPQRQLFVYSVGTHCSDVVLTHASRHGTAAPSNMQKCVICVMHGLHDIDSLGTGTGPHQAANAGRLAHCPRRGGNATARLIVCSTTLTSTAVSDLPGQTKKRGVKLPAWVLSRALQHSYPDLSLISAKPTAGRYGENVATSRRHRSWVRILELKYAPDLDARHRAMAQHDALRKPLLAAGWGRVTIHPVIIGNAGTITAETVAAFEHLDIDITLAKHIAISSIRHTAKIKRARLSRGAGKPQEAEQAGGSGPQADPDPGQSAAHAQQHAAPDTTTANPLADGHPSQDPSGEASTPPSDNAMLPMALSDTACAPTCNASPALMPEPDQWQTVVRRKRPKGASQRATTLAETEPIVCSRPDRACKRSRGSYAILADLDEDESAVDTAAPTAQRGQVRKRQQTLLPAMPETLAALPMAPAAAGHETSQRNEAPTPPLLCDRAILSPAPRAPALQATDKAALSRT